MAHSLKDLIDIAERDGYIEGDEARDHREALDRLERIEAIVTEYAAAHYAYETMLPRPDSPRFGDEIRAWNLNRAEMEQRIADARTPYKALLRDLAKEGVDR